MVEQEMDPNEPREVGDMGLFTPTLHSLPGGRVATGDQCCVFHGVEGGEEQHHREEEDSDMKEGEVDGGGDSHEEGQHQKICARGHWRPAEDGKLKGLVCKYGPQNWNLIAEKLEGRSGKSCRLRWFNQLDPRINRRAFNEEEEERLLAAHRLYGNKWALIARLFPGRTDNAIKNHWHVIMARKQREQSNVCRRRKPSASLNPSLFSPTLTQQAVLRRRVEAKTRNNALSGESTITSTRDESASTRTDLSLHSFTSNGLSSYLRRYNHQCQAHPRSVFSGPGQRMVAAENMFFKKYNDPGSSVFTQGAPMMVIPGHEQSDCSDTSSEASATELKVHGMRNDSWVHVRSETNHEREKISLPFIDFLGVGAI